MGIHIHIVKPLIIRLVGIFLLSDSVLRFQSRFYVLARRGERVVGGRRINITKYPYMAALTVGNSLCGSSLVRVNVILTAAHCFDQYKTGIEAYVQYGATNIDQGRIINIKNFTIHPEYGVKTIIDYDVAIASLAHKVALSERAQLIKLAKFNDWLPNGRLLSVAGWGQLGENIDSSDTLMVVELAKFSWQKCKEAYANVLTTRHFCTYSPNKDACHGDSGGPIVYGIKQYGIISYGEGCARKDFPGVYSNVSMIRGWIDKTIKEILHKNKRKIKHKLNIKINSNIEW